MVKEIPIKVAEKIANDFNYDQVLIFAWNRESNKQHVTTFGKSVEDCDQIAQGGNYVKKVVLGWPNNECCAEPARVKRLIKEKTEAEIKVAELTETIENANELLNLAIRIIS